MDAKFEGIEVYPPRLQYMYTNFTDIDDKIYFGMRHIKNVGTKECEKIEELVSNQDISKYTWMDVLVKVINGCKLNKRAVISLISVGAFNGVNNTKNRQEMLYEFDSWKNLSAREQKYIEENYDSKLSLSANIQSLIDNFKITSRRATTVNDIKESLENPFYDLTDSVETIAEQELKFLGCPLTCAKTDSVSGNLSNFMCKDISKGTIKGKVNLAVQINSLREYKTKNGKNPGQLMAFLAVEDSSGELDSVTVFPDAYREHRDVLIEGNTVLINGEVSKKDKSSIIVNKASQI
jgi:DNA polymerase III alpha subunit